MIKLKLYLFVFIFSCTSLYAQDNDAWVMLNTSFSLDSYNSMGPKIQLAFEQQIKNKWHGSISLETKRHTMFANNDRTIKIANNSQSLVFSASYRMNLWEDRIWFTVYSGIGTIHLFNENTDKFGSVFRLGANMNIRLYKSLSLQAYPFFILAFPQIDFSTIQISNQRFWQAQIFNLGLRYKISGSTPWDKWESNKVLSD